MFDRRHCRRGRRRGRDLVILIFDLPHKKNRPVSPRYSHKCFTDRICPGTKINVPFNYSRRDGAKLVAGSLKQFNGLTITAYVWRTRVSPLNRRRHRGGAVKNESR